MAVAREPRRSSAAGQPAAGARRTAPRPGSWQRSLPAEPGALFAYGTLQFAEVLGAMLRRVPEHAPGIVSGWRVAALAGRNYPGLVPANGATAGGMLVTGLTPAEWRLIDIYEDDFYELRQLTLADGRSGWAYAWADAAEVSPRDWSAPDFAARHLADFTQRCRAWRERYETTGQPGHVTGHH